MNARTNRSDKDPIASGKPTATTEDKPTAKGDTGSVPGTEPFPEGSAGALATPRTTALATGTDDGDFGEFAGAGLQGLGKDDLAIPFLVILQGLSPQVQRSKGEYVEGAFEGALFNTVTKEVIDPVKEPVDLIPCFYDRNFVEWRVRESGGGFVAQHSVAKGLELLTTTMRDDKNRDILPNNNQLNDTRTFFCIMVRSDGSTCPVFVTMTSTQIKKARQWLMQQSLLKKKRGDGVLYTPPMFASRWRVSTVPESNERGSWMGWAFEHVGYLRGTADPLFVEARNFHDQIAAGAVKADLSKFGGDEVDPGANTGPTGATGNPDEMGGDDIPF